jgi:hypothetical protein
VTRSLFYNLEVSAARMPQNEGALLAECSLGNAMPLTLIVFNKEAIQRSEMHLRNEELMLVSTVELVQDPEIVPIPSLVRLYDLRESICEPDEGILLWSLFDVVFKSFVRPHNREDFPFRLRGIASSKDEPTNIKSASQIVQGVAKDQREFWRESANSVHLHNIVKSLRISINRDLVSTTFEELDGVCVEIKDVLIGPFDL